MKKILLVLSMYISGCATVAPLTFKETCAVSGMKLVGVSSGSSTAIGYSAGGGTSSAVSHSESVHCEVPKTETDRAEITHLTTTAQPKLRYNEKNLGRNMLLGVGYLFYVFPGVALKLYFNGQYREAMAESEALMRQPASTEPKVTNLAP